MGTIQKGGQVWYWPTPNSPAPLNATLGESLPAALRTHDGDAPDGWQFGLGLVKFDAHGQFADFRWATQDDIDAAIQRAATQAQPEQCGHCGRRVLDPPWPVKVQPERKPMTPKQIYQICPELCNDEAIVEFARRIELHHGIGDKP